MKVFVATSKGQGARKNDFCHATDGELVTFVSECDGEAVDGACGCRRCLGGVESGKSTTTFMISDLDITRYQVIDEIKSRLIDGGWSKFSTNEEMVEWATTDADDLIMLAASFKTGMIVEKRGNKFIERRIVN